MPRAAVAEMAGVGFFGVAYLESELHGWRSCTELVGGDEKGDVWVGRRWRGMEVVVISRRGGKVELLLVFWFTTKQGEDARDEAR